MVVAQFITALHLEEEPLVAARLIELAAEARGEVALGSISFTSTSSAQKQHQFVKEVDISVAGKRRSNLPAQLTSFIGREDEIAELTARVQTTRLLTLIGAGGVGKTRLAIEVGCAVFDAFADGVWWVELAAVREGERVPQLVVKALGIDEAQQSSPLETLLNYLREKHALLVLDNCEHLIAACAHLAETVLSHCPRVQILTTSRETLNISGEIVWRVPSMSLPNIAEHDDETSLPTRLLQSESARLFVERARAIRHDFALTPATARAVANICRRLDGIPLAIELADARLKTLTVEQIDLRLANRFGLLTTGSRTALPRQQTLRATIDWSYELLPNPERVLLRRLSIFSGGWTLEAAEAVCAGGDVELAQVLDLLTHLVDKSLLFILSHEGETRFSMLETVREYAREKLMEAGEFEMTSDLHLRFYRKLAEADGKRLRGEGQLVAFRQLEAEYANLRVAFTWGLGQAANEWGHQLNGLRLAASLWHFWNMRGDYLEGYGWLQEAIEKIDVLNSSEAETRVDTNVLTELQSLKATALFGQGMLIWFRSTQVQGLELFEECAALSRQLGDWAMLTYARIWIGYWDARAGNIVKSLPEWDACQTYFLSVGDEWGVAWVFAMKGFVYRMYGDYSNARPNTEQSAEIRYKLGDRWAWSISIGMLGYIAAAQGDYATARAKFELHLAFGREYGFKWHIMFSLLALGHIECIEGNLESAIAIFKELHSLGPQMGIIHDQDESLVGLACVAAAKGHTVRAVRLFSASNARATVVNATAYAERFITDGTQALIDNLHAEMGETAFEAAWAAGQAMTLEQAVEEAMRV